jgi:hypothetical protein
MAKTNSESEPLMAAVIGHSLLRNVRAYRKRDRIGIRGVPLLRVLCCGTTNNNDE